MATEQINPENGLSEPEVQETEQKQTTLEPEKYQSPMNKLTGGYKPKESNGNSQPADEYSDIDVSNFKDLTEDDIKQYKSLKGKDLVVKLLDHTNAMKREQRLSNERLKELNALKSAPPDEKVEKYEKIINGMKSDFFGTYNKHREELGLPDISFLKNQIISGGSIEERLLQYQESYLKDKIEKDFKLEPGTFVYDKDEAFIPKTPSYRFRTLSEEKEKELKDEFVNQQTKEKNILESVIKERESQLSNLKNTFFPPDKSYEAEKDERKKAQLKQEAEQKAEDAFRGMLAELDSAWEKFNKGDMSPKGNPIAVENIFKGYFFDKLSDAKVNAAVEAVHKAYKEKGFYLNSKETPPDLTGVKGDDLARDNSKGNNGYKSPMKKLTETYTRR